MTTSTTDSRIPLRDLSASASASTSFLIPDQTASVTHSKTNGIPVFVWKILGGLVVTTIISILLLIHHDETFIGRPYHFVSSKPVIISAVIQVVSHRLGLIHVSVLTTWFNIFTRKWYRKRAVSLDCLKWWSSMCSRKFDTDLPFHLTFALVVFIAFATLPAAIWAGATTPIITTQIQPLDFSIPQYGPDPKGQFWNKSTSQSDPDITRTPLGAFSYNPVRNLVGSILDEASLATSPNASFQAHRKLDNSGFIFHGRSYGVGASIGLETLAKNDVQQYTFLEDGYLSNITCWYNTSMEFHVSLAQQSKGNWPSIYTACGDISDGSFECLPFPGLGDNEIVAMLGNPHEGHSQWGIATGINATRYANLNQTTCEAVFCPKTFNVSVDTVQKIINVTATGNAAQDIDPSSTGPGPANGQLSINIAQEMGLIVQVSNSDQFSPFGNALINNVMNTNFSKSNRFLSQNLTDSQVSLMGIESALEAMVDDILLAFSSAQFMIAGQEGGIKQTTMHATVAAIRIGDSVPIYIIAGSNAILVVLFVVSAIWNRGWRTLSTFDYQDLKSVVIGSSLGGGDIAAEVLQRTSCEGKKWNADPGDRVAGRTMVWVTNGEEGGAMIKKNA